MAFPVLRTKLHRKGVRWTEEKHQHGPAMVSDLLSGVLQPLQALQVKTQSYLGKWRFRKVFNKMVSRKTFVSYIFLLFYFSERINVIFVHFFNKRSKGLTMQIYFQWLLCLYLPRESIIRAMTVGFWTTWINESQWWQKFHYEFESNCQNRWELWAVLKLNISIMTVKMVLLNSTYNVFHIT